jgi:putative acetyltransferase
MEIRPVKHGDYKEIAELHQETIRSINSKDHSSDLIGAWSAYNTEAFFRSSDGASKRLVAIKDGKVIGFSDYSSEDCEIRGLYSHKDYTGQGIGSKLLEVSEEALKQSGCKNIILESTITARQFYENRGYKIVGKVFHVLGKEELPAFAMLKSINSAAICKSSIDN